MLPINIMYSRVFCLEIFKTNLYSTFLIEFRSKFNPGKFDYCKELKIIRSKINLSSFSIKLFLTQEDCFEPTTKIHLAPLHNEHPQNKISCQILVKFSALSK